MLKTKDAFRAIGVGSTTGFKLIARGDLEAVKLGGDRGATRITSESIRAYVDKLRGQGDAA
ncbi:excisionase [Sphingopyxis lindanitolerans]|uniref:Excisionase n=1 Tax=Sphingopyxis lindanitolerans TaxID=2054227 RepID=A0A2S8BA06_9SPHN|nr:excisionase [Sphingopyxis lindanitolerans]